MHFSLAMLLVLQQLFQFKFGNSLISLGQRATFNMVPSVRTIKTMDKKNEKLCAIECTKTKSCFSFAFGFGKCQLWDAKYQLKDELLKKETGYTYYHLNAVPNATEIKISDTNATYDEASKSCQKLFRGSLLSIHDRKMQNKLEKLLGANGEVSRLWIGLSGHMDNGRPANDDGRALKFDLRWADGHVFTIQRFHNFIPPDPNSNDRSCTSVNKGYEAGNSKFGWADEGCGNEFYYACQFAP